MSPIIPDPENPELRGIDPSDGTVVYGVSAAPLREDGSAPAPSDFKHIGWARPDAFKLSADPEPGDDELLDLRAWWAKRTWKI